MKLRWLCPQSLGEGALSDIQCKNWHCTEKKYVNQCRLTMYTPGDSTTPGDPLLLLVTPLLHHLKIICSYHNWRDHKRHIIIQN